MKIESKLVVRNNNGYKYMYVLYEQNGCRLRVNTRLKYEKGKMTKENLYNSKMPKYEELNKEILKVKMEVDRYIRHSLNKSLTAMDVYFSQDDFKRWKAHQAEIKNNWARNKPKLMKTLFDYYNDFIEYKTKSSLISTISFKNYTTLESFLKDFSHYYGEPLYLHSIDEELIKKMVDFSEIDLRELNKKRKQEGLILFKTYGNLQDVTLKKRLENFREFCEYLNDYEDTNIKVKKIFPKISKQQKQIIYINEPEYNEIIKIRDKIDKKDEKKVLDSFIFNFRAGLRFTDLSELNKNYFEKIDGGYILIKELNKGKKWNSIAQIPIVEPLLIEIIEKYNFSFNFKHNGIYNKKLHNIFERFDLLNNPIKVKKTYYKKDNEIIDTNPKDKSKPLLKRDLITSHSNRRSLITLSLTNGYSIPQVMNMTGQRNVKTVQVYADMANKELLNQNLERRLEEIKKNKNKNK